MASEHDLRTATVTEAAAAVALEDIARKLDILIDALYTIANTVADGQ